MLKKLDFNLSASTINYFVTCPFAFYQDKILKRPTVKVPSVALVLGQSFHKLMEQFYRLGTFSTGMLFKNWEKIFDVETKIQGAQKLELKFAKATGFTMIKNWVAMAKENGWLQNAYIFDDGKSGIENEFLLPYDNDRFEINVHGFMDLVIEINGQIHILDWKTGKHSEDKYTLQAILYSWALYKKYGLIEEKIRFVHPSKKENRIVDVIVKDEHYKTISKEVTKMFDAIESNKFIKMKDEKNCKWCNWLDCPNNVNEFAKDLMKKMKAEEES
jgi:predicted RecB family nuclease